MSERCGPSLQYFNRFEAKKKVNPKTSFLCRFSFDVFPSSTSCRGFLKTITPNYTARIKNRGKRDTERRFERVQKNMLWLLIAAST